MPNAGSNADDDQSPAVERRQDLVSVLGSSPDGTGGFELATSVGASRRFFLAPSSVDSPGWLSRLAGTDALWLAAKLADGVAWRGAGVMGGVGEASGGR